MNALRAGVRPRARPVVLEAGAVLADLGAAPDGLVAVVRAVVLHHAAVGLVAEVEPGDALDAVQALGEGLDAVGGWKELICFHSLLRLMSDFFNTFG